MQQPMLEALRYQLTYTFGSAPGTFTGLLPPVMAHVRGVLAAAWFYPLWCCCGLLRDAAAPGLCWVSCPALLLGSTGGHGRRLWRVGQGASCGVVLVLTSKQAVTAQAA